MAEERKREEEEEEEGKTRQRVEKEKRRMTQCALSVTHHIGWQILLWDPIKGRETKINMDVAEKEDFTTSMLCDSCQYQERGIGGRGGEKV